MKVGFHVINMLIWFMKERVSSQYGAILLGLLALLNFFLIIFFKEERNPKLCPLDYLVLFLHLNFKILFLNEQLSRFPLGQLPVGAPLVTFWLWTLLPFSFFKYSVLVPSQSHAGAKEITCLQMVLLGDHTECSALLFYLSSSCSPRC